MVPQTHPTPRVSVADDIHGCTMNNGNPRLLTSGFEDLRTAKKKGID